MKPTTAIFVVGAAIIVVMVWFMTAGPISTARAAYYKAAAVYDRDAQCSSATRLAEAWAPFGPFGFSGYWQHQADEDCEQAETNRRRRQLFGVHD